MVTQGDSTNIDFISYSIQNHSKLKEIRNNLFDFLNTDLDSIKTKKISTYWANHLQVEKPEEHKILLRTGNYLPFSGDFKLKIGSFGIKYSSISNFETEHFEDFLKTEGIISHEINSFRNDAEENNFSEVEYKNLLLTLAAIQIAKFIGHHLINGTLPVESGIFKKNPKSLNTKINMHYMQLLLSIESMSVVKIGENLQHVVANFTNSVKLIERVLSDTLYEDPSSKRVLNDMKDIIAHGNAVKDGLSNFEAKYNEKRFDGNNEIFSHLAKFITSISKTAIGQRLTIQLSPTSDLISGLNLRVKSETNRPEKDSRVKVIVLGIINQYFLLERAQLSEEVRQVTSTEELQNTPLGDIIRTALKDYEKEYLILREKFNHHSKAMDLESDVDLKFKDKISTLNDIINWYKDPELNHANQQLPILNIPKDFEHFYIELTVGSNSEERFENDIKDWNKMVAFSPEKDYNYDEKLSLVKIIRDNDGSDKIDVTMIHEKLLPSMDIIKIATVKYRKELGILDATKHLPSGASSGHDLAELKNLRKKLATTYKSTIKTLKKEDKITIETLNSFVTTIEGAIKTFSTKLSQKSGVNYTASVGAPRTMMIGLGQAGQQITRAAIARLLNTPSDVRSKNMLKGLNIQLEEEEFKDLEAVKDYKIDNALFEKFDKANILAINAGDELKRMLGAPYNFIWGTRNDPIVRQQESANCTRPATNLVLLDKEGLGSGNRMGKGRAYAVKAQSGLKAALSHKRSGQNITQVCIVHSFAGGSGSGMILPFLSIIKKELPNALIWVFSAGVEYESNDPFKDQNTTYITSDILQAHYHAIHHIPEQISSEDWDEFKELQIEGELTRVNTSWKMIKKYLKIKEPKPGKKSSDLWEKLGFAYEASWEQNDEHEVSVANSLPNSVENAKKFSEIAMEPGEQKDVKKFWKEWMKFAQDDGSKILENSISMEKTKHVADENLRFGYDLTYSNVMAIAQGVSELIKAEGDRNRALEAIDSSGIDAGENNKGGQKACVYYGANVKFEELEELVTLQQEIENFADQMRRYHGSIEILSARIQMMIGAREDSRIKHIIVSNSHLDKAASFYTGKESPYEIYNSVMVDVYVNLIHGLVEQIDYTDSDDLHDSASSFEFMDVSDLRTVTAPPIHATVVDLTNTFETNYGHGYDSNVANVGKDPVFDIFKLFFSRGESPLYNEGEKGEKKGGQANSIRSLYTNYLEGLDGLRKSSPLEVIHGLVDEEFETYCFKEDDIEELLEVILTEMPDPETWKRCNDIGFGKKELLNFANWLFMIPVEHLAMCYGTNTRAEFLQLAEQMIANQNDLMKSGNEDPNSIFNQKNRGNRMGNHVEMNLPDANSECKQEMVKLLLEFGILTPDHLAAVPSAMFYEFAPNIMLLDPDYKKKEITFIPNKNKKITIDTAMEKEFIEDNPPPSRNLAKTSPNHPLRKSPDKLDRLSGKKGFNCENLNYLRIPIITGGEKGAQVPYFEVNSQFMQHFSRLKINTGNKYPEFNSITLLDKLVSTSSNNELGMNRHTSETPKLRKSTEDLQVYSNPRKLYSEETPISVIIRMLLLGNRDKKNGRSKAIFSSVTKSVLVETNQEESLLSETFDNLSKIEFDEAFTINKFVNSISERIKIMQKMTEVSSIERIDKELKPQAAAVLKDFIDIVSEFSKNEELVELSEEDLLKRIRTQFFTDLQKKYANVSARVSEVFDIEQKSMDKTSIQRQIRSLGKFFSRLSDIWFQAKRQFDFLKGQMDAGRGVAFELEGTVDAVRSKPQMYLALMNNSYEINPMKTKNSVFHYFNSYLDGGLTEGTPTGKVYLQRLPSGPISNITLLQQKAAIIDISSAFKGLMKKLERSNFSPITDTLVHPYAFLKNILWISTMTNKWLERGNEQYVKQFEISNTIIEKIFSKPEIISSLEENVLTNDSMVGYQFSDADTKLWADVKLCAISCDAKDNPDNHRARQRAHIQLPDLLLIKAWQYAMDDNKKQTLNDLVTDRGNEYKNILDVYPKSHWQGKFKHMGLLDMVFDPIAKTSTGGDDDDWGFEDEDEEDTKTENDTGNPWLIALEIWTKFIQIDTTSKTNPKSESEEFEA
jgi:hypothetical protein